MTPSRRVRLGQPVEEHPDRDVVRDELAALHEPASLEADRRALADGGPEEISGGDVRDAEPLGQDRRLGALAGAGGAEQDQEGHRMTVLAAMARGASPSRRSDGSRERRSELGSEGLIAEVPSRMNPS